MAQRSALRLAPDSAARSPRNRLALALAAVPFALHLAALTKYGFFRDELYFIVCGRHPAFGYVDAPPLVPLLAAGSQSAGESLWLLRIIPALFHVGAVLAACAVARLLGGGRSAQILAGLATGTAPLLLGVTASLGPTSLEPLAWTLVAYAALRAVLRAQPEWWVVAGIVAGITLEDKYTLAFLLAALVAALGVAGPRAEFRRPELWFGAAVCVCVAAPSLIWQAAHGWPFLELLRAGTHGKNVVLAPGIWLANQLLIAGPAFAPLWFAGAALLIVRTRTRFAGLAVIGLYAIFFSLHAKDYYLAGIYPLLFAAGGVAAEGLIRRTAVRGAYAVVATAATLIFAPLALPLLPESEFVRYAAMLHTGRTSNEHHRTAALPQFFADMHGWRELADRVAVVERSLPADDRDRAAVYTQNYGEAAAVDVFGDGSLPVISGHNNYWLWGSHGSPAVLILIGGDPAYYRRLFADVRQAEVVRSRYAMPYENDLPIFIAREARVDFMTLWPALRHYD